MPSLDALNLQQQIIRGTGEQAKDWLRAVHAGERTVPADFNWHGMAEVATTRAHGHGTTPDLAWARVAAAIYDQLATNPSAPHRESWEQSSMLLRAALIQRLGPVPGDMVLDPEHIVRWFTAGLSLSREQAEGEIRLWEAGRLREAVPQIRELRRVKNRLNVVSVLADAQNVRLSADVKAWLALRDRLP